MSMKVALIVESAAHLFGRIVASLTVAEAWVAASVAEQDVGLETDLYGLVG